MQSLIDFTEHLARESGKLVMTHFGSQLQVERKADQTPVTIADRKAEELMRSLIGARFPDHQVLGEEGGLSGPADAPYQWVLDPIDGTKSFIHGVPLFGTLIALLEQGQPILGAIHLPALGDLLIGAQGRQTTLNGRAVRVSPTRELREATVLYTCPVEMRNQGYEQAFQRLSDQVRLVRNWGDCYGHLLVAVGRADVMFDPVLNLWDVAALKPCVEGAGGRLTDREGRGAMLGESALSTNGSLHEPVLAILKPRGEGQESG
jgi:histidinol phosphatase-like enzyme (inositol monophosphatase family)